MFLRLIVLCLTLIQLSFASSSLNINNEETNTNNNNTVIYCPDASQLVKNGDKWEATNITVVWKSYDTSFADNIASFVGAQWQGVKVGPMTCIYKAESEGVFPITLQNNHLFEQPTQNTWAIGEDGFMNCISNKVSDCPLTPKIQEETPTSTQEVFQNLNIQRP